MDRNHFDKYRIIPNVDTDVHSRRLVDTSVVLPGAYLRLPAIVPSMRYLVSELLIRSVEAMGGLVIQPRGVHYKCQQIALNSSLDTVLQVADIVNSDENGEFLSIEIAHGGMKRMGTAIQLVKKNYPNVIVWAGTVATLEGCQYLADNGADVALIGIGVGSSCSTTDVTGVGLPMMRTILECVNSPIPIVATGGLSSTGDFCKALAAGADAVMIGGLLRGCSDTTSPNKAWGEASEIAKGNKDFVEGKITDIQPINKSSLDVMKELDDALRSCMSYVGAHNMWEFHNMVRLTRL